MCGVRLNVLCPFVFMLLYMDLCTWLVNDTQQLHHVKKTIDVWLLRVFVLINLENPDSGCEYFLALPSHLGSRTYHVFGSLSVF